MKPRYIYISCTRPAPGAYRDILTLYLAGAGRNPERAIFVERFIDPASLVVTERAGSVTRYTPDLMLEVRHA